MSSLTQGAESELYGELKKGVTLPASPLKSMRIACKMENILFHERDHWSMAWTRMTRRAARGRTGLPGDEIMSCSSPAQPPPR